MRIKKFLFVVLLAAVFLNCVKISEVDTAKQKIIQVQETLFQAIEKKDLKTVMSLYANEAGTILIPPDTFEIVAGWDKIYQLWENELSTMSKVKINPGIEITGINPDLKNGWFVVAKNIELTKDSRQKNINLVLSAVLKKNDPQWFLVLTHFSVFDILAEVKIKTKNESSDTTFIIEPKNQDKFRQASKKDSTKIPKVKSASIDSTVNKKNDY